MSRDTGSWQRRTVLAACASSVTTLAGCGSPASNPDDDEGTPTPRIQDGSGTGEAYLIRLAGETDGWSGIGPEGTADEQNPLMRLRDGRTYEVVWQNLDGESHQFVIADANGEVVVSTEPAHENGQTRSVEFTARNGMDTYYCEFHPDAMSGDVRIIDG